MKPTCGASVDRNKARGCDERTAVHAVHWRIVLEVSGALVAGLAVLSVVAAAGSGAAIALAIYWAVASAAAAWLAIRQRDPVRRLLAASAGAGLTLGAAAVLIFTFGAAFLPAFLLWLLAVAELYRKASDRAEAIAVGAGRGFVAAFIGLVVTNRAEAIAAGAGLGFVAGGLWLLVWLVVATR